MFGKLAIDGAAAATAAIPTPFDALVVSPLTAWCAIAGVLLFAMGVLWLLRDDRTARPDEHTAYRRAA